MKKSQYHLKFSIAGSDYMWFLLFDISKSNLFLSTVNEVVVCNSSVVNIHTRARIDLMASTLFYPSNNKTLKHEDLKSIKGFLVDSLSKEFEQKVFRNSFKLSEYTRAELRQYIHDYFTHRYKVEEERYIGYVAMEK